MLQRRAGSHSTNSTSNHIAWTSNNFDFAPLPRTLWILALGHVDAQGASGTVNCREVPGLTRKSQAIQTDLLRPATFPGKSPKCSQWQEQLYQQLEEGMQAGTWNKMSYQENTWYIPGIFNVYIRYLPVDKEVIPVAGLAPWLFIVQRPYIRAFALHLTAHPPYFPGIYLL